MAQQNGNGIKTRRDRLSLSKKSSKVSDTGPQKGAQSIVNMFKRQKSSQIANVTMNEEETDNSDVQIIEEKSSPYFAKKGAKTHRKSARLKLTKVTPKNNSEVDFVKGDSGDSQMTLLRNDQNMTKSELTEIGSSEVIEIDSHLQSSKRKSTSHQAQHNKPGTATKRQRKLCAKIDGFEETCGQLTSTERREESAQEDIKELIETNEFDEEIELVIDNKEAKMMLDATPSNKDQVQIQNDEAMGEDDGQDELGENVNKDDEYKVPYYLENFQVILNSILKDDYLARLFNEDDRVTIEGFQSLTDEARKLYVRLFQRKLRWLRDGQILYPKIEEDLTPILQELVNSQLILNETGLTDLKDALHTLAAPDLRSLGKSLRLATTDQRPVLIEVIIKHAQQRSIGAFFNAGTKCSTNEGNVLKRAKSLLGKCYRVETNRRWVFMRAMILCSLHTISGDEGEYGNATQLFQMLMSNIGRVSYPEYKIHRKAEVFRDRDDLLTFCSAVQVAADLRDAVEGNVLEDAINIYTDVKPLAVAQLVNKHALRHVLGLSEHLRWYTAGAAYIRALTQGVEALQKTRDYSKAVQQLEELLAQRTYHTDYRGRWYERLALNLQTHLKQPNKAMQVIREALDDPAVRVGHRLAIWQRAQKMCTTASLKQLHHHWDYFKDDKMAAIKDPPKVTIEGRQLSVPGAQSTWCTEESTDGSGHLTFIRRVEDVALHHYARHGYPQGLHGEASTLSTLLALLMWDTLFMNVPDAFMGLHQVAPLDLYTDSFYSSRQDAIDSRLEWLAQASTEEISEELCHRWNEHENTLCVGLSWQLYENIDHAQGIIRCIGGKTLSLIFSRIVKNRRFTRSGFPDLIVWNTQINTFKVVEVKGPNDRLSTKQILWLDYLQNIGVDAEVCHVVAVGTKRLR